VREFCRPQAGRQNIPQLLENACENPNQRAAIQITIGRKTQKPPRHAAPGPPGIPANTTEFQLFNMARDIQNVAQPRPVSYRLPHPLGKHRQLFKQPPAQAPGHPPIDPPWHAQKLPDCHADWKTDWSQTGTATNCTQPPCTGQPHQADSNNSPNTSRGSYPTTAQADEPAPAALDPACGCLPRPQSRPGASRPNIPGIAGVVQAQPPTWQQPSISPSPPPHKRPPYHTAQPNTVTVNFSWGEDGRGDPDRAALGTIAIGRGGCARPQARVSDCADRTRTQRASSTNRPIESLRSLAGNRVEVRTRVRIPSAGRSWRLSRTVPSCDNLHTRQYAVCAIHFGNGERQLASTRSKDHDRLLPH
jgi:hypothetical protein